MNMLKIMAHAGVLRHSTAISCSFESEFKCGAAIRKAFQMDGYYHLEPKYGFTQPDGTKVHFFSLRVDDDRHV